MPLAQWLGEVVGKMHIWRISGRDLAKELDVTPEWISRILSGKSEPRDAEQKIMAAIDKIIEQRTSGS